MTMEMGGCQWWLAAGLAHAQLMKAVVFVGGWREDPETDTLKIRLLLACQDAFISAFKYPLVKAQRSLTTAKMPGLPEGVTHSSASAVERIPFKPVSFPCSQSVAATYCHGFPILSHFLSLLYCTSN